MNTFVWLPLPCALLAGVGAARAASTPFWLQPACQSEPLGFRRSRDSQFINTRHDTHEKFILLLWTWELERNESRAPEPRAIERGITERRNTSRQGMTLQLRNATKAFIHRLPDIRIMAQKIGMADNHDRGFMHGELLNVHQDELVIVSPRSFEADPENGRVSRETELANARKIQQRPRRTIRFSVGMSIMIPLKKTLERPQIRQSARDPNRPVYLAMLAKPLSLHAAIVAEQRPQRPPLIVHGFLVRRLGVLKIDNGFGELGIHDIDYATQFPCRATAIVILERIGDAIADNSEPQLGAIHRRFGRILFRRQINITAASESHADIVAEQHPLMSPASAPAIARAARSSSDQKQGGFRA